MQARVDWVLIIFGTQVIKKKRPVRPVFPDYLSVSYDYDNTHWQFLVNPALKVVFEKASNFCNNIIINNKKNLQVNF